MVLRQFYHGGMSSAPRQLMWNGICGGQSDTGRGFLQVSFSHTNSQSTKCHIYHIYNVVGIVTGYRLGDTGLRV
jgi:hypothetical protein